MAEIVRLSLFQDVETSAFTVVISPRTKRPNSKDMGLRKISSFLGEMKPSLIPNLSRDYTVIDAR